MLFLKKAKTKRRQSTPMPATSLHTELTPSIAPPLLCPHHDPTLQLVWAHANARLCSCHGRWPHPRQCQYQAPPVSWPHYHTMVGATLMSVLVLGRPLWTRCGYHLCPALGHRWGGEWRGGAEEGGAGREKAGGRVSEGDKDPRITFGWYTI
jgi:hypothetical protein